MSPRAPKPQYLPVILTMLVALGGMVAIKHRMVTASQNDVAGLSGKARQERGQGSEKIPGQDSGNDAGGTSEFSEAKTDQAQLTRSYKIDNPIAEKFAELAAQKHLDGNCKAAVKNYDRAIKSAPQVPFLYANRAICQYRLENYDAAVTDSQKALELDSSLYEAYATQSAVAWRRGNYDQALAFANQAIELEPNSGMLYVRRAEAEMGLQQPEAAIASYNEALKHTEPTAWILFSRATAHRQNGNNQAALADCDSILQLKTQEARSMRPLVHQLKESIAAPASVLDDGPLIEN